MAINFPTNPNNGDVHAGFTYNSTKGVWESVAPSMMPTSDTPPTSPSDGQMWFDTDGGGAFVYYEDADSAQWVEVIGSAGAAGADGAAGPAGADGSAAVYATVDDLPGTASAGDQAFVTASNRLYLWNGSGWYNIALINTTPTISGASSSYELARDGTATTVTITATDPEGLPITYSIASDTSGNIATVTQNANVFTITPSTNDADAGTFSLTFRASDGVNIATAVSEFTLVFKVANSNYTTALITSVGTNNAVNNTFVDSSTSSHTITAYGNATQNTFSPYRKGGYSTYFDGSGDYLTVSNSSGDFSFGTGNFTIETWVYYEAMPAGNGYPNSAWILGGGPSNSDTGFDIAVGSTNIQIGLSSFVSLNINTAHGMSAGNWYHLAVVRNGNTLTCYKNGVSLATADVTGITADSMTSGIAIGAAEPSGATSGNPNGYYSDFRVVKGTAVYTSAFTPPTERLTAITNTSLLTCHLPYFADGSTNDHTITVNGNTKIEPFSPYDYLQYDAGTDGGSVYIGGAAGNYLTIPPGTDFAMGTGDFTFEFWMYHTGYSSYLTADTHGIVWSQDVVNTNWFHIGAGTPTNRKINLQYGTSGGGSSVFSGGTWTPNAWYHVAVVRNSGSVTIYLNGKGGTPASVTQNFNNTTYVPTIGRYTHQDDLRYEGWLSDFRVVKGTAVYTADFTPPTAPLTAITNTSLLLKGTNSGIIDKSQAAKLIFLNGDVKSSTTQTKYLSSSMYFDGNGDYLTLPNNLGTNYGSSDFTVETWVYKVANPSSDSGIIDQRPVNTNGNYFMLGMSSGGQLFIYVNAYRISPSPSTAINTNTWYHVAYARSSGTGTLYIDGTSVGSWSDNTNYLNGGGFIGHHAYQGQDFNGYMSDLRITKGLARYTANFTPPAAALQG